MRYLLALLTLLLPNLAFAWPITPVCSDFAYFTGASCALNVFTFDGTSWAYDYPVTQDVTAAATSISFDYNGTGDFIVTCTGDANDCNNPTTFTLSGSGTITCQNIDTTLASGNTLQGLYFPISQTYLGTISNMVVNNSSCAVASLKTSILSLVRGMLW